MLTVLFDTNILHQEGLSSTRIQRLKRLIKASEVKLVIPEMVLEEFRSKRISIADHEFSIIKKSINNLHKKDILKETTMFGNPLSLSSVERAHLDSIKNISNDIDCWIKENNIDIYKISNTCIDSLFKSYFAGNGAFREKKKRDDIPDAVIYDAIEKISKEDHIYVIAKDGGINSAIKEIKNVTSLSSLEDFLGIDNIKKKTLELDEKDSRISEIIEFLDSASCSVLLEEYYEKTGIEELEYTFSQEIIKLSYDFEEITVVNPELKVIDPDNIDDFYLHDPNYLGNNKFSISFMFDTKVNLNFSCGQDDIEELPFSVRKLLSTSKPDERNFVHAMGVFDAKFTGVITISNISEKSTAKELEVHFSYIGADQCTISCYLEIELVEIKDI